MFSGGEHKCPARKGTKPDSANFLKNLNFTFQLTSLRGQEEDGNKEGLKPSLALKIFLPASALYSSKMLYWGASTNNIPSETFQHAANSLSGLKSEVEWRCCLPCMWSAVALLGGWQPVPSCSKRSLPVEAWKCAARQRLENTFPIMVSVAGL